MSNAETIHPSFSVSFSVGRLAPFANRVRVGLAKTAASVFGLDLFPPMQFSPPPTFSVVCLSFRSIPVWEKGGRSRSQKKLIGKEKKEKKKSIAVFVEPLFLSFARFLSARFGIKILQFFPFFYRKNVTFFNALNVLRPNKMAYKIFF